MSEQLLRFQSVKQKTGLPRSTLYRYMDQGHFPKQVKIGPQAVGWVASEVEQWIKNQIEKTRSAEVTQ